MRILHTCLRYPPATGGVESYVQQLVERTRDISQGRDVRVLSSTMRTHGPISQLDGEVLLDDPPYLQRLHHSKIPLISYPILQALPYYIGHHNPNILHGYSFWYQTADVPARYARKHNIPFIFSPMYYENDIRKKPLWQMYKKTIGHKTFAAADVVSVISPYEQSLIEQAGFPVKRFELIPPGIDMHEFATQHKNPFSDVVKSGPILLSVNRLAPGKGLVELLSMMPSILKQVPEVSLVLIGEDFGMLPTLQALANTLNIQKNVHFMGNVSRSTLLAAYQHSSVFVHPSFYEAFGIVLAEAEAAGLPVVARNTSAIPYVASVDHGAHLFTESDEAVSHIVRLLLTESLRADSARAGKAYVEQTFHWPNSIARLLALYKELAP